MKLIGLEEHFATDAILAAWNRLPPEWQDPSHAQSQAPMVDRLRTFGADRLAAMDAAGLDRAILSLTAPGTQSLLPDEAVSLARDANDLLAEAVAVHPDRLGGFATLPTPAPDAAARELSRAVTTLGLDGAMLFGRTRAVNADDPSMWPIYEAAAHHRAPLYLHPQAPLPAVSDALYAGFGEPIDTGFATFGIGWHYETGVQVLRMILAGVFDRFPDLQLITGHWGEAVLFYLDRIDNMTELAKLKRRPSEYFRDHVSVTGSGIWSQRYLRWALELLGPERLLFSTDYPYRFEPDGTARRFLAELPEPVQEAIGHGNWERLVAAIRR
ncbi:amidohydrolase family protein [Sphingomonas bacterium]|uniref:amidohydrolase family protein n=1 Tax=Sphingomonas bacterium TaxID=1895847 RepID=UPI00157757BA|nr:amidohydrolase family protein [Sphingomonas bacterium]